MPTDDNIDQKNVLNAINGGLVVLDHNARVVSWNAWMESASRITEHEARGRTLGDIFPGTRLARLHFARGAPGRTNV